MFLRSILKLSRNYSAPRTLIGSLSYDSNNKVHNKIHDLINKSDKNIFIFMKGTPQEPMCRFSGLVVQILEAHGFEFDSFDVLKDDEIRQEVKNYSDWPTIPQVYKDGAFVGGCDILLQMHQSGELEKMASQTNKS